MPMYEYECGACGQRFELIRKFSDPPLEVCALCGKGPVTRLQSSPAFQFKGSGWYVTDYAQKGKTGKTDGAPDSEKKADTTRADTKTDTKTDTGSSSDKTSAGSSDTAGKSEAPATPSTASTKPPSRE